MTESSCLFNDPESYRRGFVDGLARMLAEHEGLGVFILVLANATFDPLIYRGLREPLRQRYQLLSDRLQRQLAGGTPVSEAPDDLVVFLKLMAVGFEQLHLTEFRSAGPWQLQFNHLRGFRPPRMSDAVVEQTFARFDPSGFHFNKPFLRKEVLWEGELGGRVCRVLYNKFPFAELHALLVLDPAANKPQRLAGEDHRSVWEICAQLGQGLPGVGFGYNAYGAYASVNHQHLQMYSRSQGGYPVESAHWRHNGGDSEYPLACIRCDDPDLAWRELQALHRDNIGYNLLYRPGRLYLLPRRLQGSYRHSEWTPGFAWAELAGAVTTSNRQDYEGLDEQAIAGELALLQPD